MFAKGLVASRISSAYEAVFSFVRLHVSLESCVCQETLSAALPFAIIFLVLRVGSFDVRV